MERINNYIYDNYDLKDLEKKQMEMNLPISKESGQDYIGLIKINEMYIQQLTKLFSENNRYKKMNYCHLMIWL